MGKNSGIVYKSFLKIVDDNMHDDISENSMASSDKTILFVMTSMGVGGIQSALRNLIAELALKPSLKISILFFDKSSVTQNDFPQNIEIIDAGNIPQVIAISTKRILKKSIYLTLNRLVAGFLAKYVSQKCAYKFLFRNVKLNRKWNVAVSFGQTTKNSLYGGMNEFVLDCVCADKKIAFLHCDVAATNINNSYSNDIYKNFDKIALVSESLKHLFDESMPLLKNKTSVVYNCHNFKKIQELANENPVVYEKKFLNFITVARFSNEKGLLRVLPILSRLKKEGLFFKWNVVGGGDLAYQENFMRLAKKLEVDSDVVCFGSQVNPYRYMKNADVLLVPSYHEAAPMVFQEAEYLHLPVLSTQTCSAEELVSERKIGVVCDNSEQAIYEDMRNFIVNYDSFEFAFSQSMSNALAVKQFEDLLK